ncbi:DNA repair exonuclease [Chlorobium sp. N1]|uniref:metallophosphoesterase family protein n=1 Tax=Chlorobium sp. N1 TaxID=2491138 RepID=UPI001038B198|nr:DNA repair exonuclease [Chlorobium sp. N1]TCD48344.1 DNA repair exonuclease [Chlorobium sp. N1]
MKFIHTADWQLGKPFAGIGDPDKRALVSRERIEAVRRIGEAATRENASFVLVSGDLFDSLTPDRATVSAACGAIGSIPVPVLVIPGNHDHGGPGSIWTQRFFQAERDALAANLTVLLEERPYELPGAVVFPCPLLHRNAVADPLSWLRDPLAFSGSGDERVRIIMAHGSTQEFGSSDDDDRLAGIVSSHIDLTRLPDAAFDYLALGDWHGTKQVGPKAWYSGTPEQDRFSRGEENVPGNILLVEVGRGGVPKVEVLPTSRLGWAAEEFTFGADGDVGLLSTRLDALFGREPGRFLLELTLEGSLGIEASVQLERMLESLDARLLRLKLRNRVQTAPGPAEIEALAGNGADPLTARVAGRLVQMVEDGGDDAEPAALALRDLYGLFLGEGAR